MGRGELELLGGAPRWIATGGEQYLVGEGEARYAEVHLARHTVDLAVLFGAATPEPVRAELLGAIARMRVVGVERATDTRPYDPAVAVCEADGIPLVVPVPEGGALQTSWALQCMVAPEVDPYATPWAMWIGSLGRNDAGAEQLAREPGGARVWAEAALAETRFVEEGELELLGAPTRWYAFEGRFEESSPPRRLTVARARRGDRWVVAVLSSEIGDPARARALLEALAGAREP